MIILLYMRTGSYKAQELMIEQELELESNVAYGHFQCN